MDKIRLENQILLNNKDKLSYLRRIAWEMLKSKLENQILLERV